MQQLDNTANNFLEVVSNYTWLIVVVALIIAILLASGSRPGKPFKQMAGFHTG